MIIDYEIVKNEYLRINACYDYSSTVMIPSELNGYPVRELGPYIFSGKDIGQAKGLRFYDSSFTASDELPPRVCGNNIKEVILPQSIKKIGRYAFYGCEELRTISMYSTTLDLGNGIFMGCDKLSELHVTVDEEARSSLHELLLMLCHTVRLRYYTETDTQKELKYLLVFPPYYENNDENTPARITFRDLHGSGLYYRNCFANTAFQIERYDPLFPYAVANEETPVSMSLALSRLMFNSGLKDADRDKYSEYISEHRSDIAEVLYNFFYEDIVSFQKLRDFISSDNVDEATLTQLIEDFGKLKSAELLSLCMDIKSKKYAIDFKSTRRRKFEL